MSWDWIMSIDPHGSVHCLMVCIISFFVSGITMIAMVTVYLKRGYLEHVNTSHIHDLAKIYVWF
jgi:hypothetical protein